MIQYKDNIDILWKAGIIIVALSFMYANINANTKRIRNIRDTQSKHKKRLREVDRNEQRFKYIKQQLNNQAKELSNIRQKLNEYKSKED